MKTTFAERVNAYKKTLIAETLEQAEGNVTKAAELLGTRRTDVYRLIDLLGIPHEYRRGRA